VNPLTEKETVITMITKFEVDIERKGHTYPFHAT
jgi:hypothetical protein